MLCRRPQLNDEKWRTVHSGLHAARRQDAENASIIDIIHQQRTSQHKIAKYSQADQSVANFFAQLIGLGYFWNAKFSPRNFN